MLASEDLITAAAESPTFRARSSRRRGLLAALRAPVARMRALPHSAGMLRAVLFDLDGTLHDRASSVRLLLEAQYRQFASELRGVACEQYVQRALELDNHGYRDKRLVFTVLAAELGLEPALAPALTAHFFEAYAAHARAFPEALRVLAALRERGMRLAVITNGRQRVQQQKLERLGFAPLMDAVLISEVEGLKKPEYPNFPARAPAPGGDGGGGAICRRSSGDRREGRCRRGSIGGLAPYPGLAAAGRAALRESRGALPVAL